jgi:hypothetical protein
LLSFYIFEPLANIIKPLEQWNKEEVKAWFQSKKYSKYYEKFIELDGEDLSLLSENNFLRRCPEFGDVLCNTIQKLKAPVNKTHIFQFLFSPISARF